MVKIEKFRLAVQIKASLKFIYALIILVLNLNWKSEFPVCLFCRLQCIGEQNRF